MRRHGPQALLDINQANIQFIFLLGALCLFKKLLRLQFYLLLFPLCARLSQLLIDLLAQSE